MHVVEEVVHGGLVDGRHRLRLTDGVVHFLNSVEVDVDSRLVLHGDLAESCA